MGIPESENYVDNLELGELGANGPHYERDAAALSVGAYALRRWNRKMDRQAFAAIDRGDVAQAEAIEAKRGKRTKWGVAGLGFGFGYIGWWLLPVLFFVYSALFHGVGIDRNSFSVAAAILALATFIGVPMIIGRMRMDHNNRNRAAEWNSHMAQLTQAPKPQQPRTPPGPDVWAPAPLGADEPQRPSQPTAAPGTDEWLTDSLRRMKKNLGISDTQPLPTIEDDDK